MTPRRPAEWRLTIDFDRSSAREAEWLERALRPEVTREVPRAQTNLSRPTPRSLRLSIVAADTASLRAVVNTYLGWVRLAEASLAVARRAAVSSVPQPEALI